MAECALRAPPTASPSEKLAARRRPNPSDSPTGRVGVQGRLAMRTAKSSAPEYSSNDGLSAN